MSHGLKIASMHQAIRHLSPFQIKGVVRGIQGLIVTVDGLEAIANLGARCFIEARTGRQITCEIVGFQNGLALLMPFELLEGVGPGCAVTFLETQLKIFPSGDWLGRVIDGQGIPMDNGGPLLKGKDGIIVKPLQRQIGLKKSLGRPLDTGIRAINTFLTICEGQRMGIFSGSGVGKSTLFAQIARNSHADINIIGLIGERGREVGEFVTETLGPSGLEKSIVIAATSDTSPLVRVQAAHMTLALAEYFRDQGKQVLCLMDSVTRFAMAQREIGLSVGEPPATKGYTPSVFAELPKLLERAGPGTREGQGAITGIFTVLVDGDDHNEPIADAARGILDGHIVLTRSIAERGRFPAIDILKSISRTVPKCHTAAEQAIVKKARRHMAVYADMEDMIRLGAYRNGADPLVDDAIKYHDLLEDFLAQSAAENISLEGSFLALDTVLKAKIPPQS